MTESADPTPRPRINSMTLLIAANVAALGFLALVELSASARAQGRPRATYTAATGRVDGFQPHALFIVDETSQEVIAVQWDPQARQIKGLGYRSLANDTGEILRPRAN